MESDTKYLIQEINHQCYILAYEFNDNKIDSVEKINEESIINFIIKRKYNIDDDITTFEIINKNTNIDDLSNIFNDIVDQKYIIIIGDQEYLPYKILGNGDLYLSLKNPNRGEIFMLTKNEKYVMFDSVNIEEYCSNNNFIEFIKMAYQDYFFIVFKSTSDSVYYDELKQTVNNYNKYVVYFNDKSVKNIEIKLYYSVFGHDRFIVFESHKDFEDLFSKGINPDNHDYEKYIDHYSDSDSESD
ncbi:hypothetical protein [Powai lake megavirus]|uniref:Uncharacterized protein n=1 Tax=Powai lake megavirus TaxID=1842663 RepID=A0A167RJ33_9VIRU|nr:hypothetical protein QJ849_gp581 [Powai lake megavirus]ANB50743.1 hypothetical protein [Powai lake megavirus]WBF70628.1 hypothetical protein [Megavirus caiporensis]